MYMFSLTFVEYLPGQLFVTRSFITIIFKGIFPEGSCIVPIRAFSVASIGQYVLARKMTLILEVFVCGLFYHCLIRVWLSVQLEDICNEKYNMKNGPAYTRVLFRQGHILVCNWMSIGYQRSWNPVDSQIFTPHKKKGSLMHFLSFNFSTYDMIFKLSSSTLFMTATSSCQQSTFQKSE